MAGVSPYERDRRTARPGMPIPAWITIDEAAHLTATSAADIEVLIRSYQLRAKPVARGAVGPGRVLVRTEDLVSLRLLSPQDAVAVAPEPVAPSPELKQPILTSRRILAAAIATMLLAGAASAGNGTGNNGANADTQALACAAPGFELKVSTSRDRSNAKALCESHLEGEVYIFVAPEEGPRRVRFLVDGRLVQQEQNAPWDLGGGDGDVAKPFQSDSLVDGAHVVEARIQLDGGEIVNSVAGFTVGDATPDPTTTPEPEPTEEPSPEPTTTPEPTEDPDPDENPDPGTGWTGQAGTAGVSCPSGALTANPGESIQAAIDRAGPGGTVCIRGEHRITTALRPKGGQRIIGENATLNGTELVTNWVRDGDLWRSDGRTKSFTGGGVCERNPMACEAEDLFMDDRPLVRVASKGAVGADSFYFDESTDQMWIGRDPFGHEFEATAAATGIEGGGATNITIQGLVIEKFGNHGIVASSGWTVTRNELRWNHSHGLRFGKTVTHNFIHHNGAMGLYGQGSGLVYEENELAYNNYLNFGRAGGGYWHAGATKIVRSSDVLVLNNYSHHNRGDGWWMDWDNIRITIAGNLFESNSRSGLFYEASFDGTIRGNVFRNNGLDPNEDHGSGLFINSSKNVEVAGNTFAGNPNAIGAASTDRGTSDLYGTRSSANLYVHDNTFKVGSSGVVVTIPFSASIFPDESTRWVSNTYTALSESQRAWDWVSGPVAWSTWRGYGFDEASAIISAP